MEIMKQMHAALDLLELLLQLLKHQLKAIRGSTNMQMCCMPSLGERRCSYMASLCRLQIPRHADFMKLTEGITKQNCAAGLC